MLKIFHHWWLPLLSAITWWGMLATLFTLWGLDGFVNYSEATKPQQHIMYISDVSANKYKPIFVGGSAIQGALFILSVASEMYLRSIGRLRQHGQAWARTLAIGSLIFAVIGQLGILFVAIFDLNTHPNAHISMLVVYIVFIGFSSLMNVGSYALLDMAYSPTRRSRLALWLKVAWFTTEVVLAIAFVGSQIWFVNVPPVLEWVISMIYPFYQIIMVYDLWPANDKRPGHYPRYNLRYPYDRAQRTEETMPYEWVDDENHDAVLEKEHRHRFGSGFSPERPPPKSRAWDGANPFQRYENGSYGLPDEPFHFGSYRDSPSTAAESPYSLNGGSPASSPSKHFSPRHSPYESQYHNPYETQNETPHETPYESPYQSPSRSPLRSPLRSPYTFTMHSPVNLASFQRYQN